MTKQFFATIGLSLLLKGILGQMWSMLNALQLLTALSTLAVIMPQNVLEVQVVVLDILNGKAIPEEFIVELFNWGPKDSFLRSSIQFMAILSILALLISLLSLCKVACCCACGKKLPAALQAKLIHYSILRACL